MRIINQFTYEIMDEACALEIAHWRYAPPYDFYNHNPEHFDQIVKAYLNPDYHYYTVWDQNDQLLGFRCFGEDARVPGGDYSDDTLDMGGGLKPDLCGQGLGALVMDSVFEFAKAEYSPHAFRATVAAFNRRALHACTKVGYQEIQRFFNPSLQRTFVVLWREVI